MTPQESLAHLAHDLERAPLTVTRWSPRCRAQWRSLIARLAQYLYDLGWRRL